MNLVRPSRLAKHAHGVVANRVLAHPCELWETDVNWRCDDYA